MENVIDEHRLQPECFFSDLSTNDVDFIKTIKVDSEMIKRLYQYMLENNQLLEAIQKLAQQILKKIRITTMKKSSKRIKSNKWIKSR